MKTDSIFYRLFQTFPGILFELIGRQPTEASAYQFSSVELKQTAFRIDGLFLPTVNQPDYPIVFLEVQFQKDPEFYARFFCEIFLYLRLYAPTKAWQAVVVFAKRSLEPTEIEPYRELLTLPQVTRLYLDDLGDVSEQSLGVGIVKLIVETKKKTPALVKQLVEKARSQVVDQRLQQEVLNLIETVVLYKLPSISRQELAAMFTRDDLKKTRYYQELKQEVIEDITKEVKQEEALALILRLLPRRIGTVKPELIGRIQQLETSQLENLAEALLDFDNESNLVDWLNQSTD
ncbi:Rpn family recombination-promoting nuclease/putative transposase [Nostoc sp. UHCC 0702]|nr:Rpn family recombination-promoting nuclease/putative transposase [Nostoc sp. UHCC 0702]